MNIKDRFKKKFEDYSKENEYFKFEIREEQLEFVKSWENALKNKRIALIDAPTGIGKTFAYLYPIIERVVNERDSETYESFKAIVATSTINLQEQIFDKDIPLLRQLFQDDFSVKLLKGRRNYLCIRKAQEFIKDSNEANLVSTLIKWMNNTTNGEYQELENKFPLFHWRQIESQASTCLNRACPHNKNCYFFNARIEAENADILIVNHHLFITDVAKKEYPFIEKADAVIIDEAHNFIPTIESILTTVASKLEIKYQLSNLKELLKNKKFLKFFENETDDYLNSVEDIKNYTNIFEAETERFFVALKELFAEKGQINLNSDKIDPQLIYKFYIFLEEYVEEIDLLRLPLSQFDLKLEDFIADISEKRELFFKPHKMSFSSLVDFIEQLKSILKEQILEKKDSFLTAKWIDIKENNIVFNALDLSDSNNLSKEIIPIEKPFLLTSATLALNNKFDNIKFPLGLSDDETLELFLESPFDLKNQMSISVSDLYYTYQDKTYYDNLNNSLLQILQKGHALVLFASYYDMNLIYKKFKKEFTKKNKDIEIYIQGKEYSRTELIDIFKTEKNSILFGTRSFWEGIDVKGGKLTTVVITKLPFKSINDPVLYSKDKLLKQQGKNPFFELMLPDMILTLKQGIGRLIRSKDDVGNVYILDKRFKKSGYSNLILKEFSKYIIKDYFPNKVTQSKKKYSKKPISKAKSLF